MCVGGGVSQQRTLEALQTRVLWRWSVRDPALGPTAGSAHFKPHPQLPASEPCFLQSCFLSPGLEDSGLGPFATLS